MARCASWSTRRTARCCSGSWRPASSCSRCTRLPTLATARSDASRRRRAPQLQHEARADGFALEREVAVHAVGELAADRQAQPEAALARLSAALEALEDPVAVLGRDAGAAILHDHAHGPVAQLRMGADGPVAVDKRVVEQDPHDLRDAARVAERPDDVVAVDLDLLTARRELGPDGPQDRPDLDELGAQRDAGVDAAEVEQVAGERRESLHLRLGLG